MLVITSANEFERILTSMRSW